MIERPKAILENSSADEGQHSEEEEKSGVQKGFSSSEEEETEGKIVEEEVEDSDFQQSQVLVTESDLEISNDVEDVTIEDEEHPESDSGEDADDGEDLDYEQKDAEEEEQQETEDDEDEEGEGEGDDDDDEEEEGDENDPQEGSSKVKNQSAIVIGAPTAVREPTEAELFGVEEKKVAKGEKKKLRLVSSKKKSALEAKRPVQAEKKKVNVKKGQPNSRVQKKSLEQLPKYCTSCGKKITGKENFCGFCGKRRAKLPLPTKRKHAPAKADKKSTEGSNLSPPVKRKKATPSAKNSPAKFKKSQTVVEVGKVSSRE